MNTVHVLLIDTIKKIYIISPNVCKRNLMKNKAVKVGIIATIVPHIFCCGLPMLLAFAGLVVPDVAHYHLVPHWMEPWLFVFSGVMLLVSWCLIWRDCRCSCPGCGGKKSHRAQKIILVIVSVLFLISLVLHVVSHTHV